jgi:uncharacterized protein (DUF697 family)
MTTTGGKRKHAPGDPPPAEQEAVSGLLDAVWTAVVLADSKWSPDKSCYDLHREYQASGRSPEACADNFIDWQMAKAGGTGFVLGLPGMTFGIITIPTDLAYTTYLQLRMIAVIAMLYGWDPKSDQVKTAALLCLLGTEAANVVRQAGIQVGTRLSLNLINKIPGHALIEINKAVGMRLLTKAGSSGIINFTKLVPIIGGLVSGGLNAMTTRQIGAIAQSVFKAGPHSA